MRWAFPGRLSIRCVPGAANAHRCPCLPSRFVHFGRKEWGKSWGRRRMAANNPSRDVILQRIRDGLRTRAPDLAEKTFTAPIFEPVQNPLARFQQECKANLMECQL